MDPEDFFGNFITDAMLILDSTLHFLNLFTLTQNVPMMYWLFPKSFLFFHNYAYQVRCICQPTRQVGSETRSLSSILHVAKRGDRILRVTFCDRPGGRDCFSSSPLLLWL